MNKYNKKQIKISQIYKKKNNNNYRLMYLILHQFDHIKSLWCQQVQFSVLTILQSTQVLKAAGLDNLSGCFLKDGGKF